jgi:1-deoxy-D-xylulose-5-phosphate synthase
MRFVKPMDEELILEMAATHELLVTVEENVVAGGAGAGVSEVLAAHGVFHPVIHCGLPDRPIQHGSRDDNMKDAGLTSEGIPAFIRRFTEKETQAVASSG